MAFIYATAEQKAKLAALESKILDAETAYNERLAMVLKWKEKTVFFSLKSWEWFYSSKGTEYDIPFWDIEAASYIFEQPYFLKTFPASKSVNEKLIKLYNAVVLFYSRGCLGYFNNNTIACTSAGNYNYMATIADYSVTGILGWSQEQLQGPMSSGSKMVKELIKYLNDYTESAPSKAQQKIEDSKNEYDLYYKLLVQQDKDKTQQAAITSAAETQGEISENISELISNPVKLSASLIAVLFFIFVALKLFNK